MWSVYFSTSLMILYSFFSSPMKFSLCTIPGYFVWLLNFSRYKKVKVWRTPTILNFYFETEFVFFFWFLIKCPKRFNYMPTYDFRDKEDKGSKKKQIGKLYAFSPLNSSEKFPPEVFSRFVLSLPFRNVTGRKECTLYHFDFHFKFDFYFVCFFPNSYSKWFYLVMTFAGQ